MPIINTKNTIIIIVNSQIDLNQSHEVYIKHTIIVMEKIV